jgi:hypothetical protein
MEKGNLGSNNRGLRRKIADREAKEIVKDYHILSKKDGNIIEVKPWNSKNKRVMTKFSNKYRNIFSIGVNTKLS